MRIALPVLLFGLLLSQVNGAQVRETLESADWGWVLAGFFLFACMDLWRALRYRYLLKVRLPLLLPITVLHGTLNTILPFRIGEVSFPYLLGKCDVALDRSVPSLIWVRLLDLIVLCIAILATWLFGLEGSRLAFPPRVLAALGVALVGVGVAVCIVRQYRAGRGLEGRASLLRLPRAFVKGASRARGWLVSVRRMLTPSALGVGIVVSVLVWVENCLVSLFLLRSVGVSLSFVQVGFAASVLQFVSLLPVNVLGGLGILDLSWMALLTFYRVPFEQASQAVVATRILFYGYTLFWGLSGWLLWWGARAKEARRAAE